VLVVLLQVLVARVLCVRLAALQGGVALRAGRLGAIAAVSLPAAALLRLLSARLLWCPLALVLLLLIDVLDASVLAVAHVGSIVVVVAVIVAGVVVVVIVAVIVVVVVTAGVVVVVTAGVVVVVVVTAGVAVAVAVVGVVVAAVAITLLVAFRAALLNVLRLVELSALSLRSNIASLASVGAATTVVVVSRLLLALIVSALSAVPRPMLLLLLLLLGLILL
jgi:hypothetical protein